jgi:hypothetical protein
MTVTPPLVLLYTPTFPRMRSPVDNDCQGACTFTDDRRRLDEADAVIFHIPTLGGTDFPPKRAGQRWVAWSMESDVNYPALANPDFMRRFDVTMTYRRDSTVWCPYFGPATVAAVLAPPRPKTEPSPAVYFQSSRFDRSGRVAYVAALMRRVKVDSYGAVLHNRDLPGPDRGRDTMLDTIARYKFALVFENSIAVDYVTDKLFDAFAAGTVPVYLGAPNAADFWPAERCLIDVREFAGPTELADYLNWLDTHEDAYQEYLAWKTRGLGAPFRSLVDSLHEDVFCRLCDHLRGGARRPAP